MFYGTPIQEKCVIKPKFRYIELPKFSANAESSDVLRDAPSTCVFNSSDFVFPVLLILAFYVAPTRCRCLSPICLLLSSRTLFRHPMARLVGLVRTWASFVVGKTFSLSKGFSEVSAVCGAVSTFPCLSDALLFAFPVSEFLVLLEVVLILDLPLPVQLLLLLVCVS